MSRPLIILRLKSRVSPGLTKDVTTMRRSWHILARKGILFRKESKEEWLRMAQEHSRDVETPREGKNVYIGSDWKPVSYKGADGEEKPVTICTEYEVINRYH